MTVDGQAVGKNAPSTSNESLVSAPAYRLVAIRSHGDQCPFFRETKDVYAQLQATLRDAPVRFERVDLGDPAARESTRRKINDLRLAPVIAGRQETACLALTDLEGTAIQEFKPSMGVGRIASAIRRLTQE